jgi:hypothetical protein
LINKKSFENFKLNLSDKDKPSIQEQSVEVEPEIEHDSVDAMAAQILEDGIAKPNVAVANKTAAQPIAAASDFITNLFLFGAVWATVQAFTHFLSNFWFGVTFVPFVILFFYLLSIDGVERPKLNFWIKLGNGFKSIGQKISETAKSATTYLKTEGEWIAALGVIIAMIWLYFNINFVFLLLLAVFTVLGFISLIFKR